MRTNLIENDIKLFLETTPDVFLSTIKKRIKTWQSARDGFGRNFLDLLVYQLAIHHSKSANFWVDIFDKLDKLDFQFKSFHYFPNHELSERVTPMSSPDMAFHQKELILGLIHRNVPFENQEQIFKYVFNRLPMFSTAALDAGGSQQHEADEDHSIHYPREQGHRAGSRRGSCELVTGGGSLLRL